MTGTRRAGPEGAGPVGAGRSGSPPPGPRGPADPEGYSITAVPGGYAWTRRADERTCGPYPTREEAVRAALADRGT